MIRNPYKFLDHYTKADKDIFFGRDREVEEIYSRLFQGRLLVIYGPSGTGKTSLLQCGVANKIPDTDWMPVFIRRHENMLASVDQALARHAKKPYKAGFDTGEKLNSLYLDYLMPVYLVFDQLEELFIFGGSEEKAGFRDLLASLMQDSDSNYRVILVIREEYFADLSYLEDALPDIFENRFRVERMSKAQLAEPINGPAQVAGIRLEEGLATRIADKLLDEKGNIELTYLQVLMDRLFRLAARRNPDDVYITHADLDSFGKLGNLLAGYLDEQLSLMDNKALGEQVLKTLVSIDGTRRPMRLADIKNHIRQFGKNDAIDDDALQNTIQYFVSARILQDKDENGFYELRHDSLAARIYEFMTLTEKELLEIHQFIAHAYINFKRRKLLMQKEDLDFIHPYIGKLHLDKPIKDFIETSRSFQEKTRRRKNQLVFASVVTLLLFFSGITVWALFERREADSQKETALQAIQRTEEAELIALSEKQIAEQHRMIEEQQKTKAENAYQIAINQVYENMMGSLAISASNMNIFYRGVWNPIRISVSGMPPGNLKPFIVSGDAEIKGSDDSYEVLPGDSSSVRIGVKGLTTSENELYFGDKLFSVHDLPDPVASVAGVTGGIIYLDDLKNDPVVRAFSTAQKFFSGQEEIEVVSYHIFLMTGDGSVFVLWHQEPAITQSFFQLIEKELKSIEAEKTIIDVLIRNIKSKLDTDQTYRVLNPIRLEVASPDYNPEKQKIAENVNKMLFAAQEELHANPVKAYRFVEAAYLLDPDNEEVKSKLLSFYVKAFYDVRNRFDFNREARVFMKDDQSKIITLTYDPESASLTVDFYKAFKDSLHHFNNTVLKKAIFDHFDGVYFHANKIFIRHSSTEESRTSLLTVFDNMGEFIREIELRRLNNHISFGNTENYFVSYFPFTILTNQVYDNRASLHNSKGEIMNFLWGNKRTQIQRNRIAQIIRGRPIEVGNNPLFNHNDSLLLVQNRYRDIYVYETETGARRHVIPSVIRGNSVSFLTPDNHIVYGQSIDETSWTNYNLYQVNLNHPDHHELLVDSIKSRNVYHTNCGSYFLIPPSSNNNNYQLFDYRKNHLANYPADIFSLVDHLKQASAPINLTILEQIDNNRIVLYNRYLSNIESSVHLVLPINELGTSIIDYVNNEKIYGNIPMLNMDDLDKYWIPRNVYQDIHEKINGISNRE